MNKLLFFVILLMFPALSWAQINQDSNPAVLEISSVPDPIALGQTGYLLVRFMNSGSDPMPASSFTARIGFDDTKLDWVGNPVTLTDVNGSGDWTVFSQTSGLIRVRNTGGEISSGEVVELHIPMIAKTGIPLSSANLTLNVGVTPGFGNVAGNSDSSTGDDNTTGSVALPVKLVSFNVTKEGSLAQLTWSTTEETNSDRFEIERSANGKKWNKIGTVVSNGESKVLRNYSFSDVSPLQGENLYRLKMVDRDETFAYSRIQSVSFELAPFIVYPNPVVDFLSLDGGVDKYSNISIIDMTGKTVYSQNPVSSSVKINVKGLANGAYLVKATGLDGTIHTRKVVLAH